MKIIRSIGIIATTMLLFSACSVIPSAPQVTLPDEKKTVVVQPTTQPESEKNEARYVDYSLTAVADATKNNGKAVIFFHATWCPTCAIANKDFSENMSQIPAGVTVIKTDYDSMTDLKKKYGVTSQHTFVQVDAQGIKLAIWNGGGIAELSQKLK